MIGKILKFTTGMFANYFSASQAALFVFVLITFLSALFTYLSSEPLVLSSNISNKYLGGEQGNIFTQIFIIFGYWTFVIQIFAFFMSNLLPILFNVKSESCSFWMLREF
eukprot:220138_1